MSLEERALDWIEPYWNAEHLRRTRDWLLELDPAASEALRLAALTHDIERHFPGGPSPDLSKPPEEDFEYRRVHSERSASFVADWLRAEDGDALVDEVVRLIHLHEFGERGLDQHRWMYERIRVPRARELAAPLYERVKSLAA